MNVGEFGSHPFGACARWVRIPEDFELSEELDVEMQARAGKKPAMYVKGQGEMNVPMKIHLDARLLKTDLNEEVEWWLKTMRNHTKAKLYLFGHYWGSKYFVVTKVHQSNTRVVAGKELSCDLEVQFVEWVADGKAESSSTASTTSSKTSQSHHSSSIVKKAKSVKSAQKTVSKTSPAKTEAVKRTAKKSKNVKITVKAATKDSGKISITVGTEHGSERTRSLKPGSSTVAEKGSVISMKWSKKKTYWVQLMTTKGEAVLYNGNSGKIGPIELSQGMTVEACWR